MDKQIRSAAPALIDTVLHSAKDARLVFLGEASHGVQEFTNFKTDVLRAACGGVRPVVVVLEAGHLEVSSLPAYFSAGEIEAAVMSVLTGLFQTTAWKDLFALLSDVTPSVSVFGMDCRVRGLSDTPLSHQLHTICPQLQRRFIEAEQQIKAFNARGVVTEGARLEDFLTTRDTLISIYQDCLSGIGHGADVGGIQADRVFRQRLGLIGVLDDLDAYFAFREQTMADNVRWIEETVDPAAQIFVLTHNEHARKNIGEDDEGDSISTMLSDTGIALHSIGLYGLSGEFILNNGRVGSLDMPSDHLLEARAFQGVPENVPAVTTRDRDFYSQPILVREFCADAMSIIPAERFDETIVFRMVHPPTFLPR